MSEDRREEIYRALMDLLKEADSWGRQHNWPSQDDYPQYQPIRALAQELFDHWGLQEMEKFHNLFRKLKGEEDASWLGWFFHGVGSWMA